MMHHSGTDETTITYRETDGKFVVVGRGGYDGYMRQEFDDIEDAMDCLASMWKLNSGVAERNKYIAEASKRPLVKRHIRNSFGG